MAIQQPLAPIMMFLRGLARPALLGALFAATSLPGQNLIRNPSFEDFNHYVSPDPTRKVHYIDTFPNPHAWGLLHWGNPTIPRNSAVVSDSLINSGTLIDTIRPRSGQALAGLGVGGTQKPLSLNPKKTFFQGSLRDTLGKGCRYAFRMYYYADKHGLWPPFPVDSLRYATNDLGVYFSSQRITDRRGSDTNNVPFQSMLSMRHFQDNHNIQPQVQTSGQYFLDNTERYESLSDTFQAAGGEQYLTFGSFRPAKDISFKNLITGQVVPATDSQTYVTPYLYVDDLSLISLPPPQSMLLGPADTSLCPGDTLTVQASSPDSSYGFIWDDGSRGARREITAPGTYWVELDCPCQKTRRDSFEVREESTLPNISLGDTTVCENQSLRLELPVAGNYYLNGRAVGSSLSLRDSGHYVLRAEGPCRTQVKSFHLAHRPSPPLPALRIRDTSLCEGGKLKRELPEGFWYRLNEQPFTQDSLTLEEKGSYQLAVGHACDTALYDFDVNDNGCAPIVYVPNAFTPDGDGLNDCFEISVKQYERFQLEIYNRWGQKIFESTEPGNCWEGRFKGKPVSGAYHYRLVITNHGAGEEIIGTVMVLR